jgi:hypothetical protein
MIVALGSRTRFLSAQREDPDQIADLLIGPVFLRLLIPFGLPALTEHYAEALLETIWSGIAPEPAT